jgi:hypothetical protein
MAADRAVEFNKQLEEHRSNLTANQLKRARKKRAKLFQQVRRQLKQQKPCPAVLHCGVLCIVCRACTLFSHLPGAAMLNSKLTRQ